MTDAPVTEGPERIHRGGDPAARVTLFAQLLKRSLDSRQDAIQVAKDLDTQGLGPLAQVTAGSARPIR